MSGAESEPVKPTAAELEKARADEKARANLNAAILTMRNACDEAERVAAREPIAADAVRRVFHALAWGYANASGPIESAMAWLKDAHEAEIAGLKERT